MKKKIKDCRYCGREYEFFKPRSLFCCTNCRVKHHKLSKDFIRKLGSAVRGKASLRHYQQVYKKMVIGSDCIRWIRQSSGWFNMWWRNDCKIKGSNDVVKYCKDCSHNDTDLRY
jgi:hypothetical protein